jgi:DNA modification methylase
MHAADYSRRERGNGRGQPIREKIPYGVDYAIGNKTTWEEQHKKGLLHSGETIDTKNGDKWDGGRPAWQNEGTSIFDPVLCELCYRWFCPLGGQIVDPFAGGSVRGLVAGLLGYKYWGCDLSSDQIAANEEQHSIAPESDIQWVCGDSRLELLKSPKADFIFSCPPYGSLERYSDNPSDISTLGYEDFLIAYRKIIRRCAKRLKLNRLACFVVGDFRDKKTGRYKGFVADTICAFRDVGLELYNDAILITAVGSLPIRVTRQFEASRKLGKTHQNILVFTNGKVPKLKFAE